MKPLFVTALGVNYEVLRGLFPANDVQNETASFIRKPIDVDNLVRRVRTQLDSN